VAVELSQLQADSGSGVGVLGLGMVYGWVWVGEVIKTDKKLFRLNGDGVAEWIVATDKRKALEFAAGVWGIDTVLDHFREHLKHNQDSNPGEFIDYFVKEEPADKAFTLHREHNGPITKTTKEHLDGISEVPSYFACENW